MSKVDENLINAGRKITLTNMIVILIIYSVVLIAINNIISFFDIKIQLLTYILSWGIVLIFFTYFLGTVHENRFLKQYLKAKQKQ
tara:strand:- start:1852 stop:2106 length:255 start_codon:yes stop_codon:yes gene_type:complete